MTMKVSSETSVAMPMRNLISIVVAVGVGVWAYFGLIERLNTAETSIILIKEDILNETTRLDKELISLETGDIANNTEFRIKWPRGELGSPPADSEQFMLIEHIAGQLEAVQKQMENMMNNGVNIKRLQEDVKILREDVEKLKDSNRSIIYQNGNGKTE